MAVVRPALTMSTENGHSSWRATMTCIVGAMKVWHDSGRRGRRMAGSRLMVGCARCGRGTARALPGRLAQDRARVGEAEVGQSQVVGRNYGKVKMGRGNEIGPRREMEI